MEIPILESIEDTLIEDILSLEMELLALTQMAMGRQGHVDNFSQTTLSSIISYLVGIVGTQLREHVNEISSLLILCAERANQH